MNIDGKATLKGGENIMDPVKLPKEDAKKIKKSILLLLKNRDEGVQETVCEMLKDYYYWAGDSEREEIFETILETLKDRD